MADNKDKKKPAPKKPANGKAPAKNGNPFGYGAGNGAKKPANGNGAKKPANGNGAKKPVNGNGVKKPADKKKPAPKRK